MNGLIAAAATFVTRLCTLWFAVLIGIGALLIFARQTKITVELPSGTEPSRSLSR